MESPNTDIIAYYRLSAYTIELADLSESFARKLPPYPLLPATLLGRLAADRTYQGQHLGELILIDALTKTLLAAAHLVNFVKGRSPLPSPTPPPQTLHRPQQPAQLQ